MNQPPIELISFTDPYCTWCWGSEPILRQLEERYGSQLSLKFVMGGLVADMRQFQDPRAGIGGKDWYKQVAAHWLEASQQHKMPVDEQIYFDIKGEVFSTYPACIAVKAAQQQGDELGNRYLRALREATSAERKNIQQQEVQLQIALELGLDGQRFTNSINSGEAEQAFKDDLALCQQKGVKGFPTFLLKYGDQEVMLRSFNRFQIFESWINELSNGQIKAKSERCSSVFIFAFIC